MNPPPEAISVVIDTNVALDLLLFAEPRVQPLDAALTDGQLRWLACLRMGDELADVLQRGLAALRQADAAAVHRHWQQRVHLLDAPPPSPRSLVCDDPDDQVFIDLAVAHRARWLISRDRAVLRLARRARPLGLAILTPEAWAQVAAAAAQPEDSPPTD